MKTSTDRLLKGAIGVLLGALVLVIYFSIHERVIGVGDRAPDFTITADDGRTVSRAGFAGKVLVLNFWATWCPPCVEEMPSLSAFQRTFAGAGVAVVGISVDQDERAYRAFLERMQPAFITARDPAARINADYGTFMYPETYIIGRDGRVAQKVIGKADWMGAGMTGYIRGLL